MLFAERQRLKAIIESEAKGQQVWTQDLDSFVRQKLLYTSSDLYSYSRKAGVDNLFNEARYQTMRALGVSQLSSLYIVRNSYEDVREAILEADESIVLSLLESLYLTASTRIRTRDGLDAFEAEVKDILLGHRVSFDFIDGQFVAYESRELHQSVVVPALTLLGGRIEFAAAEKAYLEALNQIHEGTPENAITDAGTALQEALHSLGCEGNSLNPLAKSALKKGILTSHDLKLINWVEGDRSNTGDTHNAASASVEDAWLTVHVVGAIILRVVQGTPRSSP